MLAAVDDGVEGPADVVPVHPQVPGEVVAGARRDAGVGQCAFGGRGGDDRLGSVPARRRERVRAGGDGVVYELLHFITPIQFHGLDPRVAASSASPTLVPTVLSEPEG